MPLPNPDLEFIPYDPLSAGQLNDIVENVESLADGTGLNDGAIVPKSLATGLGTSWAWQSWTPTWTNLTIGSATQVFKYIQVGKTVFFRGYLTFGAGTSMGTSPLFSLPVATVDINKGTASGIAGVMGMAYYEDNGSANMQGPIQYYSTTTAGIGVYSASGAYLGNAGITATVPFTWTSGDEMRLQGFYEAA